MKRIAAVAAMVAALCGAAFAAAYDDFSRGMSALSGGKFDAAIAAFTAALQSGDLAPAYVPTARIGRARAYLARKMCSEALADVDEAMKLQPDDTSLLSLRISANMCLKNSEAVETDFAAIKAKHPGVGPIHALADYQWKVGAWAKAAESFQLAWETIDKADPHRVYFALWYAISATRDGGTADEGFMAKAVDAADGWPKPLLRFFRGEIDEAAAFDAAKAWGDERTKEQTCEAKFYIAEWRLTHGDVAGAKPLLQQAAADCPAHFLEYRTAREELERLH